MVFFAMPPGSLAPADSRWVDVEARFGAACSPKVMPWPAPWHNASSS
jgi:hypothetical protein